MQSIPNVFVIDKLENLAKYASVGPHLAKAIDFLLKGDLAKLPLGKNVIDGDNAWVNVVDAQLVKPAERKPELHKVYFDIHIPQGDDEAFGLAAFDPVALGSFNEADDIGFYDQKVEWHVVKPGEFLITWPGTCAHAPACTLGEPHVSRKLIVKARG